MPASASFDIIAAVCSNVMPEAFATGATYFIASANLSRFNAELVNDAAITSTTRLDSEASIPKPLIVAPATSADLAKSSPVA